MQRPVLSMGKKLKEKRGGVKTNKWIRNNLQSHNTRLMSLTENKFSKYFYVVSNSFRVKI